MIVSSVLVKFSESLAQINGKIYLTAATSRNSSAAELFDLSSEEAAWENSNAASAFRRPERDMGVDPVVVGLKRDGWLTVLPC